MARTDDAADFVDPVPYVAGATSYGSPFDKIYPWREMTIEERTGGTMVKIPKFYYSLTYASGTTGLKVRISRAPFDGSYVSPMHMERGDGKGGRDVCYVGRYHCASDYKSKTGVTPRGNTKRSAFRTQIHNLGANIWQFDWTTWLTILLLYLVEFANWSGQEKIGRCLSMPQNMGASDAMPYHTGTMAPDRATGNIGVQYRNIENLRGNVWTGIDGSYYNSNGLNITINPNKFSNSANGTLVGKPTYNSPTAFAISTVLGFPMFYPKQSRVSPANAGTEYTCGYWFYNTTYTILKTGFYTTLCSIINYDVDKVGDDHGARLIELPDAA